MFTDPNPETAQAYYDAITKYENNLKEFGKSDEMKAFESGLQSDVSEYGEWFAVMKGFAENPQAAFEYLVGSFSGMGEDTVLRKGAEVVSTAAVAGAGVGLAGGPAAPISVPAGVTSAISTSLPFAFAAMGGEVGGDYVNV